MCDMKVHMQTVTNKTGAESFHCSVTTFCTAFLLQILLHSDPSRPVSPWAEDMQTLYNEFAKLKKSTCHHNGGYIAWVNPLAIVMEFAPLDSLHEFFVKANEEVRWSMLNECLLVCSIQTY